MSIAAEADSLEAAVRKALLTTRAIAVCPFHVDVSIRVADDAAETHAFYRACNFIKSDGKACNHKLLADEIGHQLAQAADGVCPRCLGKSLN